MRLCGVVAGDPCSAVGERNDFSCLILNHVRPFAAGEHVRAAIGVVDFVRVSLPLARALEHQQPPAQVASLVISGANPLD